MHDRDVREALYQSYEIHGPWVRALVPWAKPIRPHWENV